MFKLEEIDRNKVRKIMKTGCAREIKRAHALFLRDKGYSSGEIGDILDITPRTALNIADKYVESGLERALKDDPRPGRPRELGNSVKARIVAIVCGSPPEGFDRWTLELLRTRITKDGIASNISKEAIRLILKEHDLKPWREKMWCVPELTPEYISRMETVLDEYETPYDPENPLVCVDEKSVQLLADKKEAVLMEEGNVKKIDYEYVRKGMSNIFIAVEPLTGKCITKVTLTRSGLEFGTFLAELEKSFPGTKKIRLVMDNLSSHTVKSLVVAKGEKEGRRIWKRFEVIYTPKHGSWLNQAEIAIGIYSRQCLGGSRIQDIEELKKRTKAWTRFIHDRKLKINWNFTKEDARSVFDYSEKIKWSEQ